MRNILMISLMCFMLTGCGAVKVVDSTLHCVPPVTGGCPLTQTKRHR